MESNTSTRGLSVRAVATFMVILTCAALLLTGVVMYFRPEWSRSPVVYRAFWTDWHIALSLLFVIAAGLHLAYNWKVLLRYLGKASSHAMAQKREMAVALTLFGVVTVAVFMQLLPFDSLKGVKHGPPPGAPNAAMQSAAPRGAGGNR